MLCEIKKELLSDDYIRKYDREESKPKL